MLTSLGEAAYLSRRQKFLDHETVVAVEVFDGERSVIPSKKCVR
jgi:hypothetical protein